MAQTLLTLLPQTPAPKETAASNTLASKSLAAAAAAAGCRLPASIHHATDMCERQSRVREGITIAEHYPTILLYYYISTSNYYIIILLYYYTTRLLHHYITMFRMAVIAVQVCLQSKPADCRRPDPSAYQ